MGTSTASSPAGDAAAAPPRLRIVVGKGGVGKSVVAAALGLAEAKCGRRSLIAEVQGGDSVASLLDAAPVGYAMREVLEHVHLVDINPQDAIREYALLTLRFETVYKAVFENRLVRRFLRLVPSLNELVMLGKVSYHMDEQDDGRPRFDVIVVDGPATGHALALLRAARVVYDTVPPGPLRDNARLIHAMLTDPQRTVLHVVTTPEEMPVNEAADIESFCVDKLGIAVGTTFINQRLQPLGDSVLSRLAPLADDPRLRGTERSLRTRELKHAAGERHLQRLPARMLATAHSLPRIVSPRFGPDALEQIAEHMRPVLEHGAHR